MRKLIVITFLLIPLSLSFITTCERQAEIRTIKASEFDMHNLERYLVLTGAPDVKIIMSQFVLETGWFRSKLFIEGNNLSGMKLPQKRSTTAVGTIFGHASYKHWTDSVDDFLLWLSYHNLGEGYINHLDTYAENKSYVNLIMNIHKKLQNELQNDY